jgi:hypothetical protein
MVIGSAWSPNSSGADRGGWSPPARVRDRLPGSAGSDHALLSILMKQRLQRQVGASVERRHDRDWTRRAKERRAVDVSVDHVEVVGALEHPFEHEEVRGDRSWAFGSSRCARRARHDCAACAVAEANKVSSWPCGTRPQSAGRLPAPCRRSRPAEPIHTGVRSARCAPRLYPASRNTGTGSVTGYRPADPPPGVLRPEFPRRHPATRCCEIGASRVDRTGQEVTAEERVDLASLALERFGHRGIVREGDAQLGVERAERLLQ